MSDDGREGPPGSGSEPFTDPHPSGPVIDEAIRPDVRWVRHRSALGPLPRWGLVLVVVLIGLLVGYRMFMDWVNDQMTPSDLPGVEVEFTIAFAHFYLREPVRWHETLGLLLVVGGVILALLST